MAKKKGGANLSMVLAISERDCVREFFERLCKEGQEYDFERSKLDPFVPAIHPIVAGPPDIKGANRVVFSEFNSTRIPSNVLDLFYRRWWKGDISYLVIRVYIRFEPDSKRMIEAGVIELSSVRQKSRAMTSYVLRQNYSPSALPKDVSSNLQNVSQLLVALNDTFCTIGNKFKGFWGEK